MDLRLFLSLFKLSAEQQEEVKEYGQRHGPNYSRVTCTRNGPPADPAFAKELLWAEDHHRVKVGSGKKAYEAAKQLLLRWGQFQLGWAEVPPTTPVVTGAPVCVVAKTLFLWIANPLRIIYVDEGTVRKPAHAKDLTPVTLQRFQFAQGCLQGHTLMGEERFALEWDRADDSVWFDIYTISRPAHPISLLTYPLVRYYQNRFKEESAGLVVKHLQHLKL